MFQADVPSFTLQIALQLLSVRNCRSRTFVIKRVAFYYRWYVTVMIMLQVYVQCHKMFSPYFLLKTATVQYMGHL